MGVAVETPNLGVFTAMIGRTAYPLPDLSGKFIKSIKEEFAVFKI